MRYRYNFGFNPFLCLLSICVGIAFHACSAELMETETFEGDIIPYTFSSSDISSSRSAEDIVAGMTLREKIGQLLFISANGNFKHEDSNDYRDLIGKISDHNIGGVMFFGGDIYGQAHLTNRLQKNSELPLLISQDMEFGAAMRVRGSTYITPAMGVAATGNPENAYLKGQLTATEARALGVHQVYAPVVDINNNPGNPIINVRSFSENPDMVSEYAGEFFRGIESEGLIATAKHFPGHGDTDMDSHVSMPTIPHELSRLDSLELKPFRALIDQGVPSIMTAHISFPALSLHDNLPGTLDAAVVNSLLRDSLDFQGLVVTDAMDMHGITNNFSPGDAAVRAINAGADVILLPPDMITAIDEIERSVERGRLDESRIDEAAERIIGWKLKLGLFEDRYVDIDNLTNQVRSPQHEQIAEQIARESITLLRNRGDIVPIRASRYPRIQVITLADDRSGSTGNSFARAVRSYHPDVGFRIFDRRTHPDDVEAMIRDAQRADLVILGSYIRVRTSQSIQLSREQRQFLSRLQNVNTPTALVSFGNPYVFEDFPDADIHLSAWSTASSQVQAATDALFGASEIGGKLPIGIPGLYDKGDGIEIPQSILREDKSEIAGFDSQKLRKIESTINQAIRDSVFPGASVAVARNGILAYHESFGYHDYTKRRKVNKTDMYDVASITKVAATTLAAMKLVDEGELSLDDKVADFLTDFEESPRDEITIKHLLNHTSGLPAFRTYVDEITERQALLEAIRSEELENDPGEKYTYSDLGFILLGNIIEDVTGESLHRYLTRNFYYPLGMQWTMFNPLHRSRNYANRTPPTENDTIYRNKEIRGEVHDERAYYLGGVAGHAGLFSTAQNLSIFSHLLLNEGTYAGRNYISPETIEKFTELQDTPGHRALGFDLKSKDGFTTAGQLTGERTFGHLGFTGTSLWIDPDENLSIILLSNRTFPNRSYGSDINQIRAEIADIVMKSLEQQDGLEIADK